MKHSQTHCFKNTLSKILSIILMVDFQNIDGANVTFSQTNTNFLMFYSNCELYNEQLSKLNMQNS